MLDAGWTVHVGWLVLAVLVGVIIGCLILGFFAGAKEPKCDECVLMCRAVSSGKGTYCSNQMAKHKAEPPLKHNWEITHADKPTRSPYRRNERRSKV